MNGLARQISTVSTRKGALIAGALAVGCGVLATGLAQADPLTLKPSDLSAAEKHAPFPQLTSVPPAPTDVRSVAAWRDAVTEVEQAGREVAETAGGEPWTLGGTAAWAQKAQEEAKAPEAITTPYEGEAADLAQDLRERATRPLRPR